ncbi:uncharacterized protein [Miscanthus floridulus]|uniref:uncharacterized protein isoform X2 n=1 Tax=Miscanthus floridulus TaxID=154761 RepID=UPI00345A12AC
MIPGIAPKTAAAPVAWAPQPRHMFVFGAGFVGRYVSERLLAQGWQVSGTCTSVTKKKELEMLGMSAFVFDATQNSLENVHSLRQATHLLISIPPIPGIGDPLFKLDEDLRRMLSHGNLEWLCYLSSTSVYGDCGGVLVDEDALDTLANSKSLSKREKLRESKQYTARIHVADIYKAVLASMSIRCASGMGPEHEVEARHGSSRGVDGEQNDAMSG